MPDSTRVQFSNRLNLDRFFFAVREQIYVVVKLWDDFPNYYRGSDIDVFCYDKNEFAKMILSVGNWYVNRGFEIEVINKGDLQVCLDFYFDGELEFRFDLRQSLPNYKRIQLKPHYIYSVIENARVLYREFNGQQYPIYVPSPVDALLLRYVEYIEWYEARPDKIKHLDYVLEAVSAEPSRISFLDKLHLYTALPAADYEEASVNRFSRLRRMARLMNRARSIPVYRVPGVLFRKLRQAVVSLL